MLKKLAKHYFVFTDNPELFSIRNGNVTTVHIEHREWPYATLLRYDFFSRVSHKLEGFDYLFFFNANIRFVGPVSPREFLPNDGQDNGLVGVLHPAYYKSGRWRYPYERIQKNSTAFLRWWLGEYYVLGGVNGGIGPNYLELIRTLRENIQRDLNNQIVAVWHDESHLNCYFNRIRPKLLTPAFGYPEGRKLPFVPKILILDKSQFGGHEYLRGTSGEMNRLASSGADNTMR